MLATYPSNECKQVMSMYSEVSLEMRRVKVSLVNKFFPYAL